MSETTLSEVARVEAHTKVLRSALPRCTNGARSATDQPRCAMEGYVRSMGCRGRAYLSTRGACSRALDDYYVSNTTSW